MPKPVLYILDCELTIHRLPPTAAIPDAVFDQSFYNISKTTNELTIICDTVLKISSPRSENGWSAIQVAGPLAFSQTGVLAGIAHALARAGISIVAVSTFDTDYILVSTQKLDLARRALKEGGYSITTCA